MAAPDRLMTAGIPDPHQPVAWLVRPWPVDANFGKVVRHFASAHPGWADTADTARHVAYYEGDRAALTAARTDEPIDAAAAQWREDMVKCIARCVEVFSNKWAAEQAAQAGGSPAPPAGRIGHRQHAS